MQCFATFSALAKRPIFLFYDPDLPSFTLPYLFGCVFLVTFDPMPPHCALEQPVPGTIAALKNHHVYVLGKSLLKFEGLRPGVKAAGLVKGCKVYFKSDIAKLRGASHWKRDGLKVCVQTRGQEKP